MKKVSIIQDSRYQSSSFTKNLFRNFVPPPQLSAPITPSKVPATITWVEQEISPAEQEKILPQPPIRERVRNHREGKISVSIQKDVYSELNQLMQIHSLGSISDAIKMLLGKEEIQRKKRKNPPSKVSLLEPGTLLKLSPFLFCPKHSSPLQVILKSIGQISCLSLVCGEGCPSVEWVSSLEKKNYRSTQESRFEVSNEFVFSFVASHLTFEDYFNVCEAFGLAPLSRCVFFSLSSQFLQKLDSLAQQHLKSMRDFSQKIGDKDLLTDGTFSQRRDANWCTIPFISDALHTVVHIEVGGKRKDQKKATELESFLSKKGITFLSEENLEICNLVHDEHSEVTKWIKQNINWLFGGKCKERHDFWHKEKGCEVNFLKYCEVLNDNQKEKAGEIAKKLRYFFVECKKGCHQNGEEFYRMWNETPKKLELDHDVERVVSSFVRNFLPFEKSEHFCSELSTSTVEGFNSFLHAKVPKTYHFPLYPQRVLLATILWNIGRLKLFAQENPKVEMPDLLWTSKLKFFQAWQGICGLKPNHHPMEENRKRKRLSQTPEGKSKSRKEIQRQRRKERIQNLSTSLENSPASSPSTSPSLSTSASSFVSLAQMSCSSSKLTNTSDYSACPTAVSSKPKPVFSSSQLKLFMEKSIAKSPSEKTKKYFQGQVEKKEKEKEKEKEKDKDKDKEKDNSALGPNILAKTSQNGCRRQMGRT